MKLHTKNACQLSVILIVVLLLNLNCAVVSVLPAIIDRLGDSKEQVYCYITLCHAYYCSVQAHNSARYIINK